MSGRPRTRIKICGIRSPEAAIAAVEAGADAVGFVRAPGSPRCIDDAALDEVIELVPPFVTRVGVFRNQPLEEIIRPGDRGLDWVQLHGDEDETFLERLDVPVLRGVAFAPETVRRWDAHPLVHALLVDGPDAGSGVPFDHAGLAALMAELDKPVVLAGGLTPDNVGDAIRAVRPWAVDVSSGVESSPGVKEPELIRAFCQAVREADGG